MKKMNAVLIDDERLARDELHELLTEFEQIEIIGEADNISSAKSLIGKLNPDVVFLDIQMPGGSGFDLINQLDFSGHIIFVTAFDEFALRAFDVNALDYLIKPIYPARLKTAIEKLTARKNPDNENLSPLSPDDYMFLSINNHKQFVKVSSLMSIIAAKDYTEVITTNNVTGLVNKSMNEWEQRLPENLFVRIHRSTIVNLTFVEKIEEWFSGSLRVHLKGIEEPFVMSRSYYYKIKEKMN